MRKLIEKIRISKLKRVFKKYRKVYKMSEQDFLFDLNKIAADTHLEECVCRNLVDATYYGFYVTKATESGIYMRNKYGNTRFIPKR